MVFRPRRKGGSMWGWYVLHQRDGDDSVVLYTAPFFPYLVATLVDSILGRWSHWGPVYLIWSRVLAWEETKRVRVLSLPLSEREKQKVCDLTGKK